MGKSAQETPLVFLLVLGVCGQARAKHIKWEISGVTISPVLEACWPHVPGQQQSSRALHVLGCPGLCAFTLQRGVRVDSSGSWPRASDPF